MIWMMLVQGLHFQGKVQRNYMVTFISQLDHSRIPSLCPAPFMPSPQYNFYTVPRVMFSKESQTISDKGVKPFSGSSGTNKLPSPRLDP